MSHKTKKNYVIYTLSKLTTYNSGRGGVIVTRANKYISFGWIPSYYTREALISRLASNYLWGSKADTILNNLSVDMSEVEVGYVKRTSCDSLFGSRTIYDYKNKYFIGVVTNDGIKAISIDDLKAEIDLVIKSKEHRRNKRLKALDYERRAQQFKFRNGNVPCIGHRKWHRGTYYRIPKLKNVATKNCSCEDETKEFVSNKYKTKNLPVWDDRTRHNDKSWKTSFKVRKQWMKHLNNHTDFDISFKTLAINSLEEDMD